MTQNSILPEFLGVTVERSLDNIIISCVSENTSLDPTYYNIKNIGKWITVKDAVKLSVKGENIQVMKCRIVKQANPGLYSFDIFINYIFF